MSCREAKRNNDVMKATKEAYSARLERKTKLRAFPLSFSRREDVFRNKTKPPTSRTSGLCSVARGWLGWYQSLFLLIKDQYLMIYASERKQELPPLHSLHLVGASFSALTKNRFAIKTSKTTYWFKPRNVEEYDQWLYTFQHVPGLYRRVSDFYEMGDKIGEGATCIVQECVSRLTGEAFALKTRLDPYDEIGRHGMYNELRILQILGKNPHPAVPHLQDYFFDKHGDIKIVMELMNRGELLTKIHQEQCLEEEEARTMFYQIADGVRHLHENCIAHRDIKPSNIMISELPHGRVQCKIIDYDLAKENYAAHWFACNPCGTAEFMAPEIVENKLYTLAIDVWSLGCVLYGMLTGHCPFRGANPTETRNNILNNRIQLEDLVSMSKEVTDLILKMLEPCPDRRLTAREVLQHPWISALSQDA